MLRATISRAASRHSIRAHHRQKRLVAVESIKRFIRCIASTQNGSSYSPNSTSITSPISYLTNQQYPFTTIPEPTRVKIGSTSKTINSISSSSPHLIPRGYLPPPSSSRQLPQTLLKHLQWMMKKDNLHQDMLLLGSPGYNNSLRRLLALTYAEMTNREVELLTLSADVTESDLKQRRELVHKNDSGGGAHVAFVDQPPVRAAINGRILIIDGIEKAERNVLPTLNNLLENREMNLEDGRFIISPKRYKEILQNDTNIETAPSSFLIPAHENFRIIALGIPCPPYGGSEGDGSMNSLDPPLRSRFQIRRINDPTMDELYTSLVENSTMNSNNNQDHVINAKLLSMFASTMNDPYTRLEGGGGMEETISTATFPSNSLDSLLKMMSLFPDTPKMSFLVRAFPLGVNHDDKINGKKKKNSGSGGTNMMNKRWKESRDLFRLVCTELHVDSTDTHFLGDGNEYEVASISKVKGPKNNDMAKISFQSTTTVPDKITVHAPCGPHEVTHIPSKEYVSTIGTKSILTSMIQEHSVSSRDILLLGPKGVGKTHVAKEFISMLGYHPSAATTSSSIDNSSSSYNVFHCYRDISSRDLLQRRTTDPNTGETKWEHSPLVKAAIKGGVCVLDGVEKLSSGTLGTLHSLLVDRLLELPDGKRLVRADQYQIYRQQHQKQAEQQSGNSKISQSDDDSMLIPIHDSFRVIALGSVTSNNNTSLSWLTDEVTSMFSTLYMPKLTESCLRSILLQSNNDCPDDVLDALLSLYQHLSDPNVAYNCGVSPLSMRNLLRIVKRVSSSDFSSSKAELHDNVTSLLVADLLPPTQRSSLETILQKVGIVRGRGGKGNNASANGTNDASGILINNDEVVIGDGTFKMKRKRTNRPELIPAPFFVDIPSHIVIIKQLLKEWKDGQERSFLLLGNQGVGKNKIVDRICQIANFEREYIQLHRDSTIGQLTLSPSLEDGRIVWKDSPLVRAVMEGRSLVIDEADKAPLDVVCVLKSLVEDGELLLADGRRILRDGAGQGIIPIHPDFTVWVLANRPGWPFHGNDFFKEVGDCFSSHVIPNPDRASEIDLLRKYAPTIEMKTLQKIASSFSDLREMSDRGDISYPYSTREAVSVVKHLEAHPQDGIFSALRNILDIDSFDRRLYSRIGDIFRRHGISLPASFLETTSTTDDGKLQIDFVGKREADGESRSPPSLGSPKVGKWDDANDPHVGGNQWAGGTGGSDTAGLGGRGGPYRLDRGHKVHQVSDEAKSMVSKEAAEAAREIARKALQERLEEIGMSETEFSMYDDFMEAIKGDIADLRGTLNSVESRKSERDWIKRQSHGEVDDSRLVDGVAGDKYIYKRRGESRAGGRLRHPKRLRFVMDCSGSMYRFNSRDERLNRCLEATTLIMESFDGMERRFDYSIVGHSGDSKCIPFVEFGHPPKNPKDRLRILQRMVAHSQFCQSGDNTLPAMAQAIIDVEEADQHESNAADECIVIGVSDANLARYGIHPRELGRIMESSDSGTKAYCIFIASFGAEAQSIIKELPVGRGFACMRTSELPRVVRQILTSQIE